MKNKAKEETAETTQIPTQKCTKGTHEGNSRPFGGRTNLAKICFNENVDIIEEFNKNTEKVEVYNKALEKACAEVKKEKITKIKRTKTPLFRYCGNR